MEMLTARDVDDLLAECVEELPAWVLERLGDTRDPRRGDAALLAVRSDAAPHHDLPRAPAGAGETRAELRRLTRAELLRLVVERLELEAARPSSSPPPASSRASG